MRGELVPLVLIPRFMSYVGEGTYTTVPLDVSEYEGATVEFWRGKLRSGTFMAYFEEATEPWEDDSLWTVLESFNTADTSGRVELTFTKAGYLRVRIVLADNTYHATGITCWAAGSLRKRLPAVAMP